MSRLNKYSGDGSIVSMLDFQHFLVDEQHEDELQAASIITHFVQDLQRDVQEPYFHKEEVSSDFIGMNFILNIFICEQL